MIAEILEDKLISCYDLSKDNQSEEDEGKAGWAPSVKVWRSEKQWLEEDG